MSFVRLSLSWIFFFGCTLLHADTTLILSTPGLNPYSIEIDNLRLSPAAEGSPSTATFDVISLTDSQKLATETNILHSGATSVSQLTSDKVNSQRLILKSLQERYRLVSLKVTQDNHSSKRYVSFEDAGEMPDEMKQEEIKRKSLQDKIKTSANLWLKQSENGDAAAYEMQATMKKLAVLVSPRPSISDLERILEEMAKTEKLIEDKKLMGKDPTKSPAAKKDIKAFKRFLEKQQELESLQPQEKSEPGNGRLMPLPYHPRPQSGGLGHGQVPPKGDGIIREYDWTPPK